MQIDPCKGDGEGRTGEETLDSVQLSGNLIRAVVAEWGGGVLKTRLAGRVVLYFSELGLQSYPCLVQSLTRGNSWKLWLQCKYSDRFQHTAAGNVSEIYSL